MAACILCGADAKDGEIAAFKLRVTELEAELAELRSENNIPTKYVQEGGVQYCIWGTSSISAYDALELKYTELREKLRKLEEQEPVALASLQDIELLDGMNGILYAFEEPYPQGYAPLYIKEPK